MRVLILIITSAWFFSACRLARTGGGTPESDDLRHTPSEGNSGASFGGQQAKPVDVDSGVILALSFNDEGMLQEKLGLRLDYFPPPRPDGASIVSCHSELAASTVIGRLTCDADQSLSVDLTAGHTKQQCYTASPGKITEARQALQLSGCKGKAKLKVILRASEPKIEILN